MIKKGNIHLQNSTSCCFLNFNVSASKLLSAGPSAGLSTAGTIVADGCDGGGLVCCSGCGMFGIELGAIGIGIVGWPF